VFGTQDIILFGIIVVVLFGASKLPQLGKGLGEAVGNFKKAVHEPDTIDVTPEKNCFQKEDAKKKEGE
jgi:sec-independent protein translocase protein TatA